MKETFPKRVFRKNKKILFVIFLAATLVSILSIFYIFFHLDSFKVPNPLIGIITLILFFLVVISVRGIYVCIDRYGDKISKNIENSKRGIDGEELAKELISKTVGISHRIFFNKELPTGGDIDCLIVGKKGLILIEIKNFSKPVRLPLSWTNGFNDPRNEAKRHAVGLVQYLSEHGYGKPIKIRKAVLYINKEVFYWGKQGVFNIRGLDRFALYFFSLPLDSAFTDQDIVKVSSLIEKLE